MENVKQLQADLRTVTNRNQEGVAILTYDDAMEKVRELMAEKIMKETSVGLESEEKMEKNKDYLLTAKSRYREYVRDVVLSNNIRVRGYEGTGLSKFIEDVVEEFVGYSILADAFNDDEVSDIYVIDWQTIFVEKNGVNVRYKKQFKNPKHFKDILERFTRTAGKEVNMGDSKIVDFELYGDRGCATSPAVTPRDYSLTIRKHAKEHIKRDDLISSGVMTEEMADFLGMLIMGESNMVYAGITGSGKTTSIRALLDHYVTKANKRMLVCEDTQELFPENEHTLELVSFKSDDKKIAISLSNLIKTSLRLKPKYIIVGEVRGEEALDAVEGMETGHSTILTMHGATPWDIVNRFVTKYLTAMPSLGIEVVERIIGSSCDYVCIQDNIPGIGRRVTSISEISYDFEKRNVSIKCICRYDFKIKDFVWEGKISRDKADKMLRRGIPLDELEPWLEPE